MSYNPAFVSDELPTASPGVSDDQSNGGIKLTSFKPLQPGGLDDNPNLVVNINENSSDQRRTDDHHHNHHHHNNHHHQNHHHNANSHQHQHRKTSDTSAASSKQNKVNKKANSNNNDNKQQAASNKHPQQQPEQQQQQQTNFLLSTSSSLSLLDSSTTLQTGAPNDLENATTATTSTTRTSEATNSLPASSYSPSTTSSSLTSATTSTGQCSAVECRDMRYAVGRGKNQKIILQDINVTVPEGSIYGLLGPSGCGKTTMLRCVVGRIKPRSGYVRVFGYQPNESGSQIPGPAIGYMPQVSFKSMLE